MSLEFEDYSVQVKAALEDAIVSFLYESGQLLQGRTVKNSDKRVDTGQTKGSYEYKVNEDEQCCQIGSNLENAIWEEFGTGEYALHGDGRKGGWVYRDAKGNFWHTKGKTPNRPLHRAFSASKNTLIRRLGQLLTEKIGKG